LTRGVLVSMPGERNYGAKLMEQQVLAIRHSSARTSDLMHLYGVTDNTIRRIVRGIGWKHLPDSVPQPAR
jgi:hypothetical protein